MPPTNPGGTPVSDGQAIQNVIDGLPPAPSAGGPTGEPNINFDPNNIDLGTPGAPLPPPPAPAPSPAPAPQPTPGQPQPAPQPPAIDPNAIPLNPVPAPTVDPNAPPAWAQGLIEEVATLKQQFAQPTGQQPSGQQQSWTPQGWEDVDARIEERARELFRQGFGELAAMQQAEAEQAEAQRQQADAYIDQQINQLTSTGYLPAIANPADPNDPGRVAQQELFAYAISLGTDNLAAVAPTLYAHHQNGYYYDRNQNKLVRRGSQTAAAQAPIAGASPSITAGNTVGPTMRDLATKDLHTLAQEASQAFPAT